MGESEGWDSSVGVQGGSMDIEESSTGLQTGGKGWTVCKGSRRTLQV
jgi:hypothetical protein